MQMSILPAQAKYCKFLFIRFHMRNCFHICASFCTSKFPIVAHLQKTAISIFICSPKSRSGKYQSLLLNCFTCFQHLEYQSNSCCAGCASLDLCEIKYGFVVLLWLSILKISKNHYCCRQRLKETGGINDLDNDAEQIRRL